jgi:hypothetical protein
VLFKPTVALQYGERPPGSEPRAQRMWRGDRVPAGAAITYRLATPVTGGAPRIIVLNAAGDTVARLLGTNTAGLNTVTWNLQASGATVVGPNAGGGRGAFGAPQPVGNLNDAGFPAGFNSRPAESRSAADSSGTPTSQARMLEAAATRAAAPGGPGGGFGGGGGGFGGSRPAFVETGDYRIVLELPGQASGATLSQSLRVVRVAPDERSVLVPARR